MIKGCSIVNDIDIKENPAQIAKERCSISQGMIINSESTSKSHTEWTTELKIVRINNVINFIIVTLNITLLFQILMNLRLIDKAFLIF